MTEKNIYCISKNRYVDSNGFLYIKNNPIMRGGIFQYRLYELFPNETSSEIVNVYRPFEELEKLCNDFANKHITLEHEWIDTDFIPERSVGNIGSGITFNKDTLEVVADIITITNKGAIQDVISGIRNKLSPGFKHEVEKSNGMFNGVKYDYIQHVLYINHIALVESPRDSQLKVNDSIQTLKNNKDNNMKSNKKMFNAILSFMKFKGIKSFDSFDTLNDDDKHKVEQALKVALQPDTDFEGGNDEKFIKLLEIAETIPFDSSDFENLSDDIDKKAVFENLIQIAASDSSDRLSQAYECLAKLTYNSENNLAQDNDSNDNPSEQDNEIAKTLKSLDEKIGLIADRVSNLENKESKTQDDDTTNKATSDNNKENQDDIDALKEVLKEEIKDEILEEEKTISEAYDSVRKVIGDFSRYNNDGKRKTQSEIYEYGLKVLSLKYGVDVGKVQDNKTAFEISSKMIKAFDKKPKDNLKKLEKITHDIKIPGDIIKERI